MKKLTLMLVMVAGLQVLHAQITVKVDNTILNTGGFGFQVMGVAPTGNTMQVDLVKGSPFFNNDWMKSKVVTEKGAVYQDVPVKVNLLENSIHYQDTKGNEWVSTTPLSEVLFEAAENGKRAHFINGNMLPGNKKGWYQLLVNNRVTLVKGYRKFLETYTSYNTAKQYSINTSESYYVFYQDKEYEMKKPSEIANLFPGQKAAIEKHMKNSKLPKEELFISTIEFVNTLVAQ